MKNWIRKKVSYLLIRLGFGLYKYYQKHICKNLFDKYNFFSRVREYKFENGVTIDDVITYLADQKNDMDLKYLGCLWQGYDLALLANIVEKEMGIKPEKVEAE